MKDSRLCNKCGLLPQDGSKPQPPCKPKCACQKKKCRKDCCGDGFVFRKVVIPAALGDDETGKDKPANGAYTNAYVEYEANGAQYMYDSYGVYTKMENGEEGGGTLNFNELDNRPKYAGELMTGDTDIPSVSAETTARQEADNGLQQQIDAITVSSDVTDVVGTYADLQAYDTSKLKDNDIVKVLQDESRNDETTYYRWDTETETFTLIGEEGPYYTKSAADQKFQDKLVAGTNITIDAVTNTISSKGGETIFYANSQETGATRHIYKDEAFTQAASVQDLLNANDEGPIILRITVYPNTDGIFSDAYIQNTYVGQNDYQFLFLDERTYREYAGSSTSDTTFYYFSNTLQSTLTAGSNIQISNNVISATDTTYTHFTGTDGLTDGVAGLVPAPITTDAGKFLKADGTWDNAGGGTLYTAVGDNEDGAMTQKATTDMVYNAAGAVNPTASGMLIAIGDGAKAANSVYNGNVICEGVAVGTGAEAGYGGIAIGKQAITKNYSNAADFSCIAIGQKAGTSNTSSDGFIHIGNNDTRATASRARSIIIGKDNTNYNTNRSYTVAIGGNVYTENYGVTIGYAAQAGQRSGSTNHYGDIAIGAEAKARSDTTSNNTSGTSSYNYATVIGRGAGTSERTYGLTALGAFAGRGASYIGSYSTLLGGGTGCAQAANYSVSLGYASNASRASEVSIGDGSSNSNYGTRYLANVRDPQNAQDAATKNYVDMFYPVGTVYTSTSATAPTFVGGTWTDIGTQTIGNSTVHYYERTA